MSSTSHLKLAGYWNFSASPVSLRDQITAMTSGRSLIHTEPQNKVKSTSCCLLEGRIATETFKATTNVLREIEKD